MRRAIPEVEQKRRQFWFDTAVKGLAAQGFKKSMSMRHDDMTERCAYRGSHGRRCAIGWLMDSETANEADLNRVSAFELRILNGQELNIEDRYFLSDLQDAHDSGPNECSEMKRRLADFAKEYGLSIPEELK